MILKHSFILQWTYLSKRNVVFAICVHVVASSPQRVSFLSPRFRQQRQKGGAPTRPYDKEHCERLVEDLDRFGAECFVAGDYQKALGAFNHSLQVKTQIMQDCDNCSTAITIHCIADVYSKKGKWIQAMDAYNAALQVLEKADDAEEVRRSRVALEQKVQIIRRLLGIQDAKSTK